MNEQNEVWTAQQDSLLLELRHQRKLTKWSEIAKVLEQQFDVRGRNGKKCRERYENYLNPEVKREEWTPQEEKHLIELHNEKGNKWVEIARQLQRTDNSVKNHYHSKLRKALRKINKCIDDHLRGSFRPFKTNILSKIVQQAEEYTGLERETHAPEQAKAAFMLKNKIINYAQLSQTQINSGQIQQIRRLSSQICHFTQSQRRNEKSETGLKTSSNKYKGKQIISLIEENIDQRERGVSSRRKTSQTSLCEDLMSSQEEGHVEIRRNQSLTEIQKMCPQTWSSFNSFVNTQPMYFFNENMFSYQPYCYPFAQQGSPTLFSGKGSSFTFYHSANEKRFEGMTNSSMNSIEIELCRKEAELNNSWSDSHSL